MSRAEVGVVTREVDNRRLTARPTLRHSAPRDDGSDLDDVTILEHGVGRNECAVADDEVSLPAEAEVVQHGIGSPPPGHLHLAPRLTQANDHAGRLREVRTSRPWPRRSRCTVTFSGRRRTARPTSRPMTTAHPTTRQPCSERITPRRTAVLARFLVDGKATARIRPVESQRRSCVDDPPGDRGGRRRQPTPHQPRRRP